MIRQKSKSPLALMEQAIMILVFALAAALCVQAFVLADTMSRGAHDRDMAANRSQTVAETLKALEGSLVNTAVLLEAELVGLEQSMFISSSDEPVLRIYYDKEWEQIPVGLVGETGIPQDAVYCLKLVDLEYDGYLCRGRIRVEEMEKEKELFALPVSWQEVAHD